jgi:hypothetical protein
MRLTVINYAWDEGMAKILCRCDGVDRTATQQTAAPTQGPGGAPPSQQQGREQETEGHVGEAPPDGARGGPREVALFLPSKASHAFDLSPGATLRVQAPWHEVRIPGAAAPVVLAHLVTQSAQQEVTGQRLS